MSAPPAKSPSSFRRIATNVLIFVGALTLAGIAIFAITMSLRCVSGDGVPSKVVLELDLDRGLAESNAGDPFAGLGGASDPTLRSVVETLDRAAADDRVVGLIAYVGGTNQGMARTQEVRAAVLRFREAGKFTIAFGESYGEMSTGNQGYLLASAFDEVWLQPSGSLGLTGLIASSQFLKGTLEMLDVELHGDKRREYKNAFNQYTERRFTEAHAEATKSLLDDLQEDIVVGIAQGRGMERDEVWAQIQAGPFLAQEALDRGLVDHLGYRDEAIAAAKLKGGEDAELLFAHKYAERADPRYDGEKRIALVYAVGAVMRGPSQNDPLTGSKTMGSDTVAGAIRTAVADEDVVAIVLRVDSPGGSPVASDVIWREVEQAKAAGKPVIVSMGNVAASGGYYVAAGATKIVAQSGTITGSIGVFAGKPNLRKLWNKVGITHDSLSTSPNAEIYSQLHGYDEHGKERLQASLDQIYIDFKTKVAEGRGLTLEQVEEIARGRVWTGKAAKERGLVDRLGGLDIALEEAALAGELDPEDGFKLVVYPVDQGFLANLLGGDNGDNSEEHRPAEARVQLGLERWRPVLRQLEEVGLGPDGRQGVMAMPPLELNP